MSGCHNLIGIIYFITIRPIEHSCQVKPSPCSIQPESANMLWLYTTDHFTVIIRVNHTVIILIFQFDKARTKVRQVVREQSPVVYYPFIQYPFFRILIKRKVVYRIKALYVESINLSYRLTYNSTKIIRADIRSPVGLRTQYSCRSIQFIHYIFIE